MFNCKTVQASPFRGRLDFFFAMTGSRIVQIFFCTVASKRATFAPKRGIGEGGFFPPQRNRMGTNPWEQAVIRQRGSSPHRRFSQKQGACSHVCSHPVPTLFPSLFPSAKNGRCKKAHNKAIFPFTNIFLGTKYPLY